MEEEAKVIVIELITREDGSVGLGNSSEVPISEAIEMVEAKTAKSETHSIGVVPDEWLR